MNVKMNKAIMELPEVKEIFVFPSCGDETNCIAHSSMAAGSCEQPVITKALPRTSRSESQSYSKRDAARETGPRPHRPTTHSAA
jgi:predicted NodU family carbamoyl transferase